MRQKPVMWRVRAERKDEAMGDRATVWVSIPVSVVQEDIERNGGSPSSLLLDG
jgi:hypothetical protein